jgi:hypothetical protein
LSPSYRPFEQGPSQMNHHPHQRLSSPMPTNPALSYKQPMPLSFLPNGPANFMNGSTSLPTHLPQPTPTRRNLVSPSLPTSISARRPSPSSIIHSSPLAGLDVSISSSSQNFKLDSMDDESFESTPRPTPQRVRNKRKDFVCCPEEHKMEKFSGTKPEKYVQSEDVICDLCNFCPLQDIALFFYHCSECSYDLCNDCATVQTAKTASLRTVKLEKSVSYLCVSLCVRLLPRRNVTSQWHFCCASGADGPGWV